MHLRAEYKCVNLPRKYEAEEGYACASEATGSDLLSLNPISGYKSGRAKRIIVT